jgi:hypothetical protein
MGGGTEPPQAPGDEQERPPGGIISLDLVPGAAGEVEEEEGKVGLGPMGGELGSQRVSPGRAAGRLHEAGLEEKAAPDCMPGCAMLGEGQEAEATLRALANGQAGVDPGGAASRVGRGLVDQRLEHRGEAAGVLRGDWQELSPMQEGADAIRGCEVGAPKHGEVDPRVNALEAGLDALEERIPGCAVVAVALSLDVLDSAAERLGVRGALDAHNGEWERRILRADQEQLGLGSVEVLARGESKGRHG